MPSPTPTVSQQAQCIPATDLMISDVSAGIVERGATLSRVYLVPAQRLSSGPPIVMTDAFSAARWVAGMISGAGVRPEVAIWLGDGRLPREGGALLSVNAAAHRYSSWPFDTADPIRGDGLEEAVACVGPIPEP